VRPSSASVNFFVYKVTFLPYDIPPHMPHSNRFKARTPNEPTEFSYVLGESVEYSYIPQNNYVCLVGSVSLIAHIVILLTMYAQASDLLISDNMIKHAWYTVTITTLFLIEHTVWLNLLWISVDQNECSCMLILAYAGILLSTISLLVEVVVPVDPDPDGVHKLFCLLFMVGGSINVISSLIILPGSAQGVDSMYKYVMVGITLLGYAAAFTWYALMFSEKEQNHASFLEHASYILYLLFIFVGIVGSRY
jgi:hypothetical protein